MKKNLKLHTTLLLLFISLVIKGQLNVPNIVVDNNASDGECTIIINRQSPSNILAGANPERVYRSSNSGLTWTKSSINTFSSASIIGDVTLAADNSGRFYYQSLDGSLFLYTFRSTDFGATWNTETVQGVGNYSEDKNWIITDNVPASNYEDNLYCAYTRRPWGGSKGYIFLTHSVDNGVSWSAKDTLDIELSTVPPIGAGLAIGPAGEVNVSWGGGSPNQIHFKKSTDGATSWPINHTVIDNTVLPIANYYSNINHSVDYCSQFTSLACDVSGGMYNGNLYCTWSDMRNGVSNADVFMAKSTDGGVTWATQRINDDFTSRHQVLPTVAVDPTSGWVYISYLDGRLNKDNFDDTLHYYLAFSKDGGQSFQNVRVSQQPSVSLNIHSDYMGMDAYGGNVHLLWASENAGNLQILTAHVTQLILGTIEDQVVEPSLVFFPTYPNPFSVFTTFDFKLAQAQPVTLIITDINGKEVARPLDNVAYSQGQHQFLFDNYLAAGLYVATITTPSSSSSRKISVIR